MNFKLIGDFFGTPNKYEDFEKNILSKAFTNYFNDNVEVFLYNHHDNSEPINRTAVKEIFKDYISANSSDNKNKVFIINWGWHHVSGTTRIVDCFGDKEICNSDSVRFDAEKAYKSEITHKSKNGIVLSTFHTAPEGYSVIYFLWDAFHLTNEDTLTEWQKQLLSFAVGSKNTNVFLKKYSEVSLEGKDKFSGKKFVSIEEKAKLVVGEDKIDSIIDEMVEKAPVKEIVLFLNQVLNSGNTGRYRTNTKHLFVTKENVKVWLRPWAEAKWPYYVLFGHNFEIKKDCSFKLREGKDNILISSMLGDFKRKFIKYAPILDMFSVSEFLSNSVSNSHEKLSKYKPFVCGVKLSKYLSEFFDDKEFDIELSKFIQNKEVNSIIHISINPMDYMTSSVTKHDWHSCHSLFDGQFAGGCLSYMFDSGSLVSFMASDKEYIYNLDGKNKPFTWNSKSWRQIVYGSYSENMFVFCREYPQHYKNDDITKSVRSLLEDTISSFCDIPNNWVVKKNGAKSNSDIYKNAVGTAHYDDVPTNETVLVRHKMNIQNKKPIIVGANFNCPISGKKITYPNNEAKRCIFDRSIL